MKIHQFQLIKIYNKSTNFTSRRSYSTSSNSGIDLPIPVLTIRDLHHEDSISSKRNLLSNKGGIYSFTNKINGKQYIGSAKDLYLRLNEHLSNRKYNRALQAAISKYGLDNFNIFIYEYFTYENKVTSSKFLTDLETMYIRKFKFKNYI